MKDGGNCNFNKQAGGERVIINDILSSRAVGGEGRRKATEEIVEASGGKPRS